MLDLNCGIMKFDGVDKFFFVVVLVMLILGGIGVLIIWVLWVVYVVGQEFIVIIKFNELIFFC